MEWILFSTPDMAALSHRPAIAPAGAGVIRPPLTTMVRGRGPEVPDPAP